MSCARFLFVAACLGACDSGSGGGDDGAGLGCPDGAVTFRAERADGYELWCERAADGVANGPYERHAADDTLVAAGAFDDGVACGTWRELAAGVELSHVDYAACGAGVEPPDPDPTLAVVGDFGWDGTSCGAGTTLQTEGNTRFCATAAGVKQGDYGTWYEGAGTKASGGQYRDGLASGTWRAWYPSGTVSAEGPRGADGRDGVWTTWRADRTRETVGTYAAGLRDGAWTSYWPDGGTHEAGGYHADAKDGAWRSFYPSGAEHISDHWAAGRRDGAYVARYESGGHAEEGAYRDDLATGPWTTWYDNGVKATEGSYDAGLPVGSWSTWDRDGLPASAGAYVAGYADGTWSFWRWQIGERVKATGQVVRGVLEGPWHAAHDPGGEPAGDVSYVHGVREGPSTTVWKNGQLASEGSYLGGELNGRWKFYYPSGQLFLDCGFVLAAALGTSGASPYDGAYVEYWDNGQVKAEGTYHAGTKADDWHYFAADGQPTSNAGDGS